MPDFGKIAYEAYASHAEWKSLVNGSQLLSWGDLPQEIKDAWDVSANAVLNYNGSEQAVS